MRIRLKNIGATVLSFFMRIRLKHIGIIATIVIMLEIVAWIGISLLGKNAGKLMRDFYFPKELKATEPIINDDEKCSAFDSKIFCIKERK